MASIGLNELNKTYENGQVAVRDVSLSVDDGEFLVLVGPSGCGKSTTLRMLAGLEEVTSGDIHIGDRRVNDIEPGKRDIAMVFQNYALYPHMTVRQNMSFGLKMRSTDKAEIKRRVDEAAQLLSIESLLDRRPKELSGGQRQRVAVGRAIVRQPAVFLFDEPLSNLDAKLRVQMRKELAQLHHRLQTTTIYVTHDQVEAMTLGQRIVVMHEGRIQQVATPLEIYDKPANRFVASFIGSPAMNLVGGRVSQNEAPNGAQNEGQPHFENQTIRFPIQLPTGQSQIRDCVFGFRPENISLSDSDPKLGDVTVDLVERFGDETMIYFQLAETPCVGRLSGNQPCQRYDVIPLHLPRDKWNLFDSDSGGALLA